MFANKTEIGLVRILLKALNLISKRAGMNITYEHQLKLRLAEKYLQEVIADQGREIEYIPGKGFRLVSDTKSKSKSYA